MGSHSSARHDRPRGVRDLEPPLRGSHERQAAGDVDVTRVPVQLDRPRELRRAAWACGATDRSSPVRQAVAVLIAPVLEGLGVADRVRVAVCDVDGPVVVDRE